MKQLLTLLSCLVLLTTNAQNVNLKGRGKVKVGGDVVTTPTTTPNPPTITGDDNSNTLSASSTLGASEILVSVNGGAFVAYTGAITVGDVARPAGYWQFKIKSATNRNESSVVGSPAFTANVTPVPPTLSADDIANTLSATSTLGISEILVSENGGAFLPYTGAIQVGNVDRAAGYWKFKIRSALGRNESPIVSSAAFTVTLTTPAPPTLTADDNTNTLIASSSLGQSEILVSVNGAAYVAYTGQINVGDVDRPIGYWKFKIRANSTRTESSVVNSPAFTVAPIPNTTPNPPTIVSDDNTNVISATHSLGTSEILISINNAPFIQYDGVAINFGNIDLPGGYYKFKIKAAAGRNESAIASSPAFSSVATPPPVNNVFTYTVPNTSPTSMTSAGIYKPDGSLVRTLWSGVTKTAGTYTIAWDGTDDKFQTLPVSNYVFKVLTNNVQYTWEGVAGNTSSGPSRHRSFESVNKMLFVGSTAYFSTGYNEGNANVLAFNSSDIQTQLDPYSGFGGWVASNQIATDGVNIYITARDVYNDTKSFVYARKISDNSFVNFTTGVSYSCVGGGALLALFPNVIDLRSTSYEPTGIAVSSSYIFVAYQAGNIVSVLNKTTGALVQTVPFNGPTSLAIDGNNLWVASSGNKVQRWPINADGTLGAVNTTITGFSSIVDVKVNGTSIAVVDGGASQQVKTYNTSTGASLWTLGQVGGVITSPLVTDDKFGFSDRGGIAFAPDGSFWVVDAVNSRMQHYDVNRNFIERIMYLPNTRTAVVVGNNNKRVLANGVEFEIDYTKPLSTGWKLKYNWIGGLNNIVTEEYIKSVNVLSNGRTYGIVSRTIAPFGNQIVELSPTTGIRYTKVAMNGIGDAVKMYADGSVIGTLGYGLNNETQAWYKATLQSFDSDGDPVYTTAQLPIGQGHVNIAGEPRLSGPHIFPYEVTATGILPLFNGNTYPDNGVENGYRLGGMRLSDGKMMFRTSIETFPQYSGEFPKDGYYDVGNTIWYGGNVAVSQDKSIIWGYNGERWKASQTNKYNHYYDDGLFVGQFGATGPEFDDGRNLAFAGNAFMPQLTKEGSDYYLYHNDESVYGGLHRWKITNLSSIVEQSVPLPTTFVRGNENALPPNVIDLMAGLPYRGTLINNAAGWIMSPNVVDPPRLEAVTNVLTYGQRKSPDLDIYYRGTNVVTINRTLGANSGLSQWSISGNIAYGARQPNYWNGNGPNAYLDVLDNAGKIIVRIYQINNTSFSTTNFTVNNTVMFSKPQGVMQLFTKNLTPIKITKSAGSIIVNYSTFSATITTPFEVGANMSNPTAMRLYFNNGNGENGEKNINLDGFIFNNSSSTASVNTTYYISNLGQASNTGLSSSDPWPYSKVQGGNSNLIRNYNVNILFNRGETFTGVTDLGGYWSGTQTDTLRYGAYGTGARPILTTLAPISGSTVAGNWRQLGSTNTWALKLPVNVLYTPRLYLSGVEWGHAKDSTLISPTKRTSWGVFDGGATQYVYVYSEGNPTTFYSSVKTANLTTNTLNIDGQGKVAMRDLDIRGGNGSTVDLAYANNSLIENCVIGLESVREGLRVNGCNNLEVRNTLFTTGLNTKGEHYTFGEGGDAIILGTNPTSNINIHDCQFYNWVHGALWAEQAGGAGVTLSNINFHHNFATGRDLVYGRGFGAYGLTTSGINIEYNNFSNFPVQNQMAAPGLTINQNIFDTVTNTTDGNHPEGVGYALEIRHQTYLPQNMTITNNTISNCAQGGIHVGTYIGDGSADKMIMNNIIDNNTFRNNGYATINPTYDVNLTPPNKDIIIRDALSLGSNTWRNNKFARLAGDKAIFYGHDVANSYLKSVSEFNTANGTAGDVISGNIIIP